MTDLTYIQNRKRYTRPQGLLFANSPGTVESGFYVPEGDEFGVTNIDTGEYLSPEWMVLTDNNRKEISMSFERIEQRKRMVNGRTRSVHIADKLKLSTSWDMIPSRAFYGPQTAAISQAGDDRGNENYDGISRANRFTTDGGAGGADMLRWYKEHPGTFWVFIAYDNFHNYDTEVDPWENLNRYNERVEMYISDFSHNVMKRGGLFDFWNVSLSLEEA